MELQAKKILNLPVLTQSGKELGKISGFDVDPESQTVIRYYVKSSRFIAELFSRELIVAATQVVSLTEEKMVVEDLDLKERKKLFGKNQLGKNKAAPPVSLNDTLN